MQVLEGLEPVRKRPACTSAPPDLRSAPPRGRSGQLGRRGHGRPLRPHRRRCSPTVAPGRRQRPGIPTDINPSTTCPASRSRHRCTARQVRQRLQGVRRPPRRRCVGRQRPADEARRRGRPHGKRHAMTFVDGGKPTERKVVGDASPRAPAVAAGARPSPSGPTRRSETVESRPDHPRRLQMMAFSTRARDPLPRAPGPRQRTGHLQVQRRHRRLVARQQDEGEPVLEGRLLRRLGRELRGRDRVPVEHRLQHRRHPQLRQRHQHRRGRHPRRGLQGGAHLGGQQVRPRQEPAQGEGPEPHGRGHPRGHHGHRLGARLREPQFEGQTKAKLGNTSIKTLVQRATNEKLSTGSRRTPPRPTRSSARASPPPRRATPPRRPATSCAARRCSTGRACRTSSRTARRRTGPSASCSSSRATRPAARRSRPATPPPRRSSPSGARS